MSRRSEGETVQAKARTGAKSKEGRGKSTVTEQARKDG